MMMKSVFDGGTRAEVIGRINSLTANSQPHWGKMTAAQMVKHCALTDEYYSGHISVSRSMLGLIIGKFALKGILKDETSSFQRNAPTPRAFKVTEVIGDFESERNRWKSLIERYGAFNKDEFIHFFFGRMNRVQLGQFIYKHCDHHLRQFGV